MAVSLATLSACASSHGEPRVAATAAPVIQTRTEVVMQCPAELHGEVAGKPAVPGDAELSGNASGLAWLSDLVAWAQGNFDRLNDAKEACP